MVQVSAAELDAWLKDARRPRPLLLDVREPWEYAYCRIEGSHNIPMRGIPASIEQIERGQDIVVICHHGVRSWQVGRFLEHQGCTRIHNLQGGVDGWAKTVDPAMPTY
jgi:rhodanese-related sulfurtransferase